jgi:hypothetical protein
MLIGLELDSPISELKLSVRARNCLIQSNIQTLGELLSLSDDEIWDIRNLGRGTFEELNKIREEAIRIGMVSPMFLPQSQEEYFYDLDGVKWVDKNVVDLDLSVRAKHGLLRGGVTKASQMLALTEHKLYNTRNLGVKTINEILECINSLKFEVPGNNEPNSASHFSPIIESVLEDFSDANVRCDKKMLARAIRGVLYAQSSELDESKNISNLFQDYPQLLMNIGENDYVKAILKQHIYSILKASLTPVNLFILKQSLPNLFNQSEIVQSILREMVSEKQIEFTAQGIQIWIETISSFVASIEKENAKIIVQKRLEGCTLEEVGRIVGVTRERVRQVESKTLSKRPILLEDKYKSIFETYLLSKHEFLTILGEPEITFNYLNLTCEKGSKTIEEMISDQALPTQYRVNAEKLFYGNCVQIDSVWIKKTKSEILKHLIRHNQGREMHFDDFLEIYNQFLVDHNLVELQEALTESTRYLESSLLNHPEVLWKQGRTFRYYDVSNYDMTYFFARLNLEQYVDIEISSLKLLREHAALMREYDVRDEYELHNLLKKHYPVPSGLKIAFPRMPTIEFGIPDRDMQVLNILLEHAPISKVDLAKVYEDMYGAKSQTVMGSYVAHIEEYYHDGQYNLDFPPMPIEQFEYLKTHLNEDFYYISDITKFYLDNIPGGERKYINSYNLKRLGFKVNNSYVFQESYLSAENYLRSVLLKDDTFSYEDDITKYNKIQSFYTVFTELRDNLELIEYAKDKYVKFSKLEESGITKDGLRRILCTHKFDVAYE